MPTTTAIQSQLPLTLEQSCSYSYKLFLLKNNLDAHRFEDSIQCFPSGPFQSHDHALRMFLRTAFRSPLGAITTHPHPALRCFGTSALVAAKPLPPRPTVNEADLVENFLKGSGPGGQKIVCTPFASEKHLTSADNPVPCTEQNVIRRATEAPAHRYGRQVTSHALPDTEPQDC